MLSQRNNLILILTLIPSPYAQNFVLDQMKYFECNFLPFESPF